MSVYNFASIFFNFLYTLKPSGCQIILIKE